MSYTPSDITSIASMVVAVLALLATIWQAKLTRDHNRKSTTPIITFHQVTNPGYHVFIRNDGVGPAIISGYYSFVDNEPCRSPSELTPRLQLPQGAQFFFAGVVPPACVGVGQCIDLIRVSAEPKDEPAANALRNASTFGLPTRPFTENSSPRACGDT